MIKSFLTSIIVIAFIVIGFTQTQINESLPFQSDPSKDYSIVVPSSYVEGESIAAFLALHPWNTDRWNGETWCEELADFAEANNVILVCPDGGADGKIDDPIDTAFASYILDSAFLWYDIDPDQLYAIGFSWGGKTTYTYGLNHIDKFAGLLPIGAAINLNEINGISENINGKPVYVVHGSLDSPNTRFYPIVDAMEDGGACVETNLLQGVSHTIDFDNQVEILTAAFDYLKDNACTTTSIHQTNKEEVKLLPYNSIKKGSTIQLQLYTKEQWSILSIDGKIIKRGHTSSILMDLNYGKYVLNYNSKAEVFRITD